MGEEADALEDMYGYEEELNECLECGRSCQFSFCEECNTWLSGNDKRRLLQNRRMMQCGSKK